MNLDLGPSLASRTFVVGPFTLRFPNDYDQRRTQLSAQATETVPAARVGPHVVPIIGAQPRVTPARAGASIITASAEAAERGEALLALPPLPRDTPEPAIWDLCLVLSYVTGRRVFLPEDERRYRPNHHGEAAIEHGNFIEALRTAWEARSNLAGEEKVRPLWYRLHVNDTPEAEIRSALSSVALEIIVRDVAGAAPPTSYDKKVEALKKDLQRVIRSSDVPDESKERLMSTIGNWGRKSPQAGFRRFVAAYGLAPADPEEPVMSQRIDFVNSVRNGVVHAGRLNHPKWIKHDDEREQQRRRSATAAFVAAILVPTLVQIHLNEHLGLSSFSWPRQDVERVREYFERGTWAGQRIEEGASADF